MTPSPDTGAGTPPEADVLENDIRELRGAEPGELARRLIERGWSRPATDPAGLDLTFAAFPHFGSWRHARWCSWERVEGDCSCRLDDLERALRAAPARISVADGPGPEERPDWRGHLNAIRRLLVGSPPNADMIDAVIGYALNDCEAAIAAALEEPTHD